jgi:hypothetical protein
MNIYIKQNLHNQRWFWQAVVGSYAVAVQPGDCATADECKAELRLFAMRMKAAEIKSDDFDLDFEFKLVEAKTV